MLPLQPHVQVASPGAAKQGGQWARSLPALSQWLNLDMEPSPFSSAFTCQGRCPRATGRRPGGRVPSRRPPQAGPRHLCPEPHQALRTVGLSLSCPHRCPGEQEDRRPCTPHTWQLLPEPAGHVRGQWGQRRQQLRAPPRPRASQVSVRPSEAGAAHGLGRRLHTTWATGSSSSVTQAEGQRGCGGLGFSAACSGPAAPQVPSHLQGPGLSSCKPSARGLPASSRAGLRAAVFWDGGVLPYLAPSLAP